MTTPRRQPNSTTWADIYRGVPATPEAANAAQPETWVAARLPAAAMRAAAFPADAASVTLVTLPANAQSLIIFNPFRQSTVYLAFRAQPYPARDDYDLVCPPQSILVAPIVRDRGDTSIQLSIYAYPQWDTTALDVAPLIVYATDQWALPETSFLGGAMASEQAVQDVITFLSAQSKIGPAVGTTPSTATVGTAAVALLAAGVARNARLIIQNRGAQSIFVGNANTVTTANGLEIGSGEALELDVGATTTLWAISGTAGQDVRKLLTEYAS